MGGMAQGTTLVLCSVTRGILYSGCLLSICLLISCITSLSLATAFLSTTSLLSPIDGCCRWPWHGTACTWGGCGMGFGGGGEEVRSNFMSLTNGIRSVSLVFGGVSDNPHPTSTSHPPLSDYNCGQCWRVLNGSRLVIRVRKKRKKKTTSPGIRLQREIVILSLLPHRWSTRQIDRLIDQLIFPHCDST